MKKLAKLTVAAGIAALTLSTFATPSMAKVVASGTNGSNFSFTTATALVPISGAATSISFNSARAGQVIVTFSAECAANAAAGANASWVDIDVRMNGVAISPTNQTADAFCTSNGTAGFDGWVRASVTLVAPVVIGNNTVTILGRLNNGATGGWLSDSATVIEK